MSTFTNLYDTYAGQPAHLDLNQIQEKLSPYIEQFDIKIDNNAITIGKKYQPLNTILADRICAIVDEPQELYIVLRNSIFALNKESGEVKINIRDL